MFCFGPLGKSCSSFRLSATWLRSPSEQPSFTALQPNLAETLDLSTEMERGEEPADLGLSFVATLLRCDLPQKAACVCVCVCGTFSCTKVASRPILECLRYEHEQGDQGCLTWPGPTKLQVLHQDMAEGPFSHVPALDDKLLVTHWILCRDVDAVGL